MSASPDAVAIADPTRRLFSALTEHPALGLTSGYLLISLLGLSYEWTLFRQFGVNYFHYADVTDFLMGAFREPVTFVLALSAVAVGKLAHLQLEWEDRWFSKHEARSWMGRAYRRMSRAEINRYSPVALFFLYVVMFIWIYSDHRAERIRDGGGYPVQVSLAEGSPADEAFSATLLGTSSRFVFLFEGRAGLTWVVPHENLSWIRVATPGPGP